MYQHLTLDYTFFELCLPPVSAQLREHEPGAAIERLNANLADLNRNLIRY
jgi:hypothetical protein